MTQRLIQMKCRFMTGTGPDSTECGALAVAMILTETIEDHVHGDPNPPVIIEAWPLCNDHAPEAVHETVVSSADTDYLILQIPPFGIGELT